MDEMSGWVMAEYRSICLLDDPPADLDVPSAEDVDDYLPPPDAPDGFDLVTAAPGIVTVNTGVMRGRVHLTVHVLDSEPRELAAGDWDTIEEITFRALSAYTHAAAGDYYPFAARTPGMFERSVTPAGAGFYRVRAHEVHRVKAFGEHLDDDDPPTAERFLIQLWPTTVEDDNLRRIKGRTPPLML
ncbi:hypothetical protein [Rhodococcus qingshengii]|uniref:hypothetical protein n=1 Tax=Rhodococcus qingshengii TaxID=334542 RepID=UPI001BE864DA|nr:hypothetical protein [Rhodococcus qingshengii]MBT2276202.1 hypothetical protein [Rhodococcus qingshengii]